MPKANKVNVKEKVEDNVCDLSLSELREIPVKEIVSMRNERTKTWPFGQKCICKQKKKHTNVIMKEETL